MHVAGPQTALAAEPTPTTQRIDVVDVIRGVAVSGILFANILLISGATAPAWGEGAARADWVARAVERLFVEKAFYPLFSLLFGLGLVLQMKRAEGSGPLIRRRLLVVLLIALAHWMLVWDAFILINYAVLGFALLLFRDRSPRVLFSWIVLSLVCYAASPKLTRWTDRALARLPVAGQVIRQQDAELRENAREWAQKRHERLGSGSYMAVVTERAERFGRVFSRPRQYYPWAYGGIFAMFLLGLYIGRRGILRDQVCYLPFFRAVLWSGLLLGIAAKATAMGLEYARPGGARTFYVAYGLERVGGLALAFAYASALVVLYQRSEWRRRLAGFGAAGRMALTNYLLQSLICTTLFYGYGLGLYRRVGMTQAMAIAAAICVVLLALSRWWLRQFQFGPAEWLWRSCTYGRVQPFVVRRPSTTGVPASSSIVTEGVVGR